MKDAFKQVLVDAGLKMTGPRIAVLEALRKLSKPADAKEIHACIATGDVDPVTVYRILASFAEAGIVRRVDLRQDSVLYELGAHHHHHLVCTECGMIEDFESCDIEMVTKKILSKSTKFASVKEHSLELFGLCKKCT